MAKKTAPLSIRIAEEVRVALGEASRDEERSVSSFVERVLAGWLRDKGYLEKPKAKRGS